MSSDMFKCFEKNVCLQVKLSNDYFPIFSK